MDLFSNNDNIFKTAFEALHTSLAQISYYPQIDVGSQSSQVSIISISNIICDDVHRKSKDRLIHIRALKGDISKTFSKELKKQEQLHGIINEIKANAVDAGTLRKEVVRRRLAQQQSLSDRRLRELIFEITGEYGKSILRAKRREDFLRISGRILLTQAVWRLRWERFLHRLCYEFNDKSRMNSCTILITSKSVSLSSGSSSPDVTGVVLCQRKDVLEIRAVQDLVYERCSKEILKDKKLVSVIKFLRVTRDKDQPSQNGPSVLNTANSFSIPKPIDRLPAISTVASSLPTLLTELKTWLQGDRGVRRQSPSGMPPNRSSSIVSKLTTMNGASQSNLAEIVRVTCIEWMHIPSYDPNFWDKYVDTFMKNIHETTLVGNTEQNTSGQNRNGIKRNTTSSEGLDIFSERYTSQHSSFVSQPNAFFCLEERVAALEELKIFPDVGLGRDEPALAGLRIIQSVYVTATQRHFTLSALRRKLCESSLEIVGFVGKHREVAAKLTGLDSMVVASYPDVIQVICGSDGTLLHFAPLLLLSLPETQTFLSMSVSSDQLRAASARCPHPHLPLLCSSSEAPLAQIYCVVKPSRAPSSSVMSEKNRTYTSNSGSSEAFMKPALLPLSDSCMHELLRVYLWPDEYEPSQCGAGASVFDLLPDHARCRKYRPHGDRLNHTYVLLVDALEPSSSRGDDDDSGGEGSEDSPTKPSHRPRNRPCSYLVQLWNGSETAAEDFLPPSAVSEQQKKLQNSQATETVSIYEQTESQQQDDGMLRAMLSGFSKGLGGESAVASFRSSHPSPGTRSKWDPTLLSTVCRWRACACEATESPPPKYLCAYHSELKTFLDSSVGGGKGTGESIKYLPMKVPPHISTSLSMREKDLELIRAASSLLQELRAGKLHSTLRSFAARVCADMTLCRVKSLKGEGASEGAVVPSDEVSRVRQPSWAVWRDERELRRMLDRLTIIRQRFEMAKSMERAITDEFRMFQELGVFPTAELAILRREIKNFKELSEGLDISEVSELESRLCEKKLSLIRSKRVEDQNAKSMIQKRALKLKLLEEEQARDPANFRNQKRF